MLKKELETSLVLPVTSEFIERRIFLVRGQKVLLDSDLAELYQVSTKNLNKAVDRNKERFPADFMFRLNRDEHESLRFQIGTSKIGRGGRRYAPHAFTELGVAMLSSVLKSDRAIQMNIYIIRAFVKLRELLFTHKEFARKLEVIEREQKEQGKDITSLVIVLNKMKKDVDKLLVEKEKLRSAIGFEI